MAPSLLETGSQVKEGARRPTGPLLTPMDSYSSPAQVAMRRDTPLSSPMPLSLRVRDLRAKLPPPQSASIGHHETCSRNCHVGHHLPAPGVGDSILSMPQPPNPKEDPSSPAAWCVIPDLACLFCPVTRAQGQPRPRGMRFPLPGEAKSLFTSVSFSCTREGAPLFLMRFLGPGPLAQNLACVLRSTHFLQ
ncbi:hypothetical protein HJG60_009119 [Phyllostomus discolor]|uniref:Uncharacterized protein n=1 Tax=Phyllostomus discolor TaxID=89673 RepID=A0A833YPX6_9CHIR|nr:hypothetical protein HJG60_009119 [Phyllostomus discolor]